MTTPTPGRLWAVTVTVPADIDEGDRDDLFDLIADTAHKWEPVDRDGWDVDVSAGPVIDHPLRTKLAAAERSKSALVAKVKRLENRLAIARGALPARDVRQGWADAVARADVAEAEVDALRRALTPDLGTDGELIAAHDTHRPVCATCGGSRFKPWKLLSDDDVVGALRAICDRTGTSIPCPDCTEDTNHAEG